MEAPGKNKLWLGSFALHFTRGIVRDQTVRRRVMGILIGLALIAMVGGSMFLDSAIGPRWYLAYWLVCAWLTFTALLMALFDILMVRAQARAARRAMKEGLTVRE